MTLDEIKVSYFPTIGKTTNPDTVSIASLCDEIKNGAYKEQVENVTKLKEDYVADPTSEKETAWKDAKKELPNFTTSGTFTRRNGESLIKHSGLMQIDVDPKDNPNKTKDELRAIVEDDPHTFVVFDSPSGDGVKGFARVSINPDDHLGCYEAMRQTYAAKRVVIDDNCKDISRACFVSYDPHLYQAPFEKVQEFKPVPLPEREPAKNGDSEIGEEPYYTIEVAKDALKAIKDIHGGNLEGEYELWLKILSGMFNSYGEDGFQAVEEIIGGDGYQEKRGKLLKDIGVGTVIHYARENAGWRGDVAMVDRFFYEGKKGYRFESSQGRYIAQNISDVRRRLKKSGIKNHDIDDKIDHIQENRDICYAGEISGRMAGFYDEGGTRFLVTKSPHFIKPKESEFPTIKAILEGALLKHESPENANKQLDSFYGWLQTGVISLRGSNEQHGQAMAFVGGVDCGKSFIQDYIITPCLGGRSAKAALFMQGGTAFNSDLFKAEHLILSDEFMTRDMKSRGKLAANLKKFTVSTHGEQLHAKGVDAISITPWWRVSISLNDTPENLLILPPLNDDVHDKIIILRASREPFPMPTKTAMEKKALREQIEQELPGFLWWLLNKYQIPQERECGRFCISTWHNDEILKLIHAESEEGQFLTLIDSHFWSGNDEADEIIPRLEKWQGEALELKNQLCSSGSHAAQRSAEKLLGTWSNKPGKLLGKLKKLHGGRIRSKITNGKTIWTIYPPE
ncbi:hypothetical protein HW115_01720 [Verrucomicrobiaceae bacterium N1E253]|uniref:BT4734-like N-terminal domain-containing protein n=1 Tax=Oceaniferula marina TaxID=2748318 RepID=A0A851GBJ3_9BACT|nr:BT4734/BF3469 family protein [Oceaniferula marina]NWK54312.1 hypothetical protein [Oceaniferula marina]